MQSREPAQRAAVGSADCSTVRRISSRGAAEEGVYRRRVKKRPGNANDERPHQVDLVPDKRAVSVRIVAKLSESESELEPATERAGCLVLRQRNPEFLEEVAPRPWNLPQEVKPRQLLGLSEQTPQNSELQERAVCWEASDQECIPYRIERGQSSAKHEGGLELHVAGVYRGEY